MRSRTHIIHSSIFALVVVTSALGQPPAADNVALPIERRVMLETTLMLNNQEYQVRVEHVLYDGDDLTTVYHYNNDPPSEPLRRRRQFAIEVLVKPAGAPEADRWTAFRTPTTPFGISDMGFAVAPPVSGVGVLHRADGDRLMVADWRLSRNWGACVIWTVEPERRMTPVPRVLHIDHMSSKSNPPVDDVWVFSQGPEYLTAIQLARLYYVDPDCRLYLSGDAESIEVVCGAWGRDEYTIETHRSDLTTGEVTTHPPTPQQSAPFDAMTLDGPPEHIPQDLPPGVHEH
jgi:hypothetical protein